MKQTSRRHSTSMTARAQAPSPPTTLAVCCVPLDRTLPRLRSRS
ncbi:hypothetical protein KVV02_006942 [Mortierella alpina]|uniref:Uncharacterized protein n=1 Tax=Mortierella alpina TaxID=64518 RepID=A0A9P8CVL3_MORAP|nr:hypothetical protein KVV02_006942 [Mortierella alpina]